LIFSAAVKDVIASYRRQSRKDDATNRSPEQDLLLLSGRSHLHPEAVPDIRRRLNEQVDWEKLGDLALVHGVTPLVYARLVRPFPELIPERVVNSLRDKFIANARKNFFVTAELLRLLELFALRDIVAIPFKGPVLAASVYGDIGLREFGDLDIFVKKTQIAAAASLLLSHGYILQSLGSPAVDYGLEEEVQDDPVAAYLGPKYYVFVHRDHRMRVDLQWRLTQDYFSFPIELLDATGQLIQVDILDQKVLTFGATDLLLVLCAHGAKHQWQRLKWICDVAEVLRAYNNQIDWDRMEKKASQRGIKRMLSLGLFLSKELLDAPVPPEFLATIGDVSRKRKLARKATQTLFGSDQQQNDFRKVAFYLGITDRWRDRMHFCSVYLAQFVSAVVVPTPLERNIIRLPKWLRFVYVLLRVARLTAKFARRGTMRNVHAVK
jgi:hypothetical protein